MPRAAVATRQLGETPWVDRHLHRSWQSIAARVGPEFLPVQMANKRRFSVYEFGCGAYGCVSPTHKPGVVLKITGDASEAWFAWIAMQIAQRDGWPPGIVQYYEVLRLPKTHRRRKLFLLWRQEATEVGKVARVSRYELNTLGRNLNQFRDAAQAVLAVGRTSKNFLELMSDAEGYTNRAWDLVAENVTYGNNDQIHLNYLGKMSGAMRVAVALRYCYVVAEHMENTYQNDTIGGALMYYLQRGLLLCDVHAGNVGLAVHENYAQSIPAITDPGLALPLTQPLIESQIPESASI